MKLATKLTIMILVLLGGIGFVGLFGLYQMSRLNEKSAEISSNWLPSTVSIQQINTMTSDFRTYEVSHVYSEDDELLRMYSAQMARILEKINKQIRIYEALLTNTQERVIYDEFSRNWKSYMEVHARMIRLSDEKKTDEAIRLLLKDSLGLFENATNALLKAVDFNVKNGELASAEADRLYGQSVWAVSIAVGIMILVAAVLGFVILRDTLRALGKDPGELRAIAQRVTQGDYNVDDGSVKRGVYGNLVEMVDALKANIAKANEESENAHKESENAKRAMLEAKTASDQAAAKTQAMLKAADKLEEVANTVSSASEELSAQIEQSERGAADQASRVTETATAMEEMNSTVLEVARNAGAASDVSAATRKKAEAGAAVVQDVVTRIQDVQAQSTRLKEDMVNLDANARAISQIMSVISDIADQTNLLALNAAIEAARAGEAGRGFAVVADEVRKLAEKTMASTTDVGNAIRAIQQSAAQSMAQVDNSVQSIGEATALATQSGQALAEIVNMVDNTADQVRAIATASEQQSATSDEINRSIGHVNNIAAETARAMQESARAVADLTGQAQVLARLIDDMKRG